MSNGRHAAAKHRRQPATRRRRAKPPERGRPKRADRAASTASATTGTGTVGRTTGRTRSQRAPSGVPYTVVGAAAVAVAAVGGLTLPEARGLAVTAAGQVPKNFKIESIPLDHQFANLRAEATDLVGRASRAQERISLEERIAEARKKADVERERAETLRPRYVLPVSGYRISAGFGDISALWSTYHTGQDFVVPTGTSVHAVADGVIVESGWHGSYGWYVTIRHKDGTKTLYAHNSAIVRRSGTVQAGDVITRSGSTGNSTGPHLHLEVIVNDRPINPMPWLRERGLL